MNDDSEIAQVISGLVITVLVLVACVFGVRLYVHWVKSFPTTYCTQWTRAVSIKPTNHDNGKYSDEQYIVTYDDGSIDGQSQGDIPYARCTNKVQTTEAPKSDWKIVDPFGQVDWEQ